MARAEIEVVVAPVLHEYVVPPDAVSVKEFPLQTEISVPALIADEELTNTATESLFEQPTALVPVTVYVEVEVATAEIDVVVSPVLHKYVVPPDAVSVKEIPLQREISAPALTTGVGFTNTLAVSLLIQPFALAPVTVYVVAEVGEIVIAVVVAFVFHE